MVTRSETIDPVLVVFLTFLLSACQHSRDTGSNVIIMEEEEAIESHSGDECACTQTHTHIHTNKHNEGVPAVLQGQSLNGTAI